MQYFAVYCIISSIGLKPTNTSWSKGIQALTIFRGRYMNVVCHRNIIYTYWIKVWIKKCPYKRKVCYWETYGLTNLGPKNDKTIFPHLCNNLVALALFSSSLYIIGLAHCCRTYKSRECNRAIKFSFIFGKLINYELQLYCLIMINHDLLDSQILQTYN